jgi:predicted transcriptional regulator YdeE
MTSLSIVLAACLFWRGSPETGEPQRVSLPGFNVIGLSTRTTNKDEMSGNSKIGPLWASFARDGNRIQDVADPDVTFSIYTNYETDENGPYDVILGKEVHGLRHVPKGMRGIRIPTADYLVFPVADPSPQAIGAAWRAVYAYFAEHKELPRIYGIDFERHSKDRVEIYVSARQP